MYHAVLLLHFLFEVHWLARFTLDFRLISVYLGDMRGKMFSRRTSFETVAASDILVSFVNAIYVFPEVRRATVALVAQIAREEIMNHSSVIAELLEARKF